jgi:hypothetical protein
MKAANSPPNPARATTDGPYARTAAFPVTLAGPLVDGDALLRDVLVVLVFPALVVDVIRVNVEFVLTVVVEIGLVIVLTALVVMERSVEVL